MQYSDALRTVNSRMLALQNQPLFISVIVKRARFHIFLSASIFILTCIIASSFPYAFGATIKDIDSQKFRLGFEYALFYGVLVGIMVTAQFNLSTLYDRTKIIALHVFFSENDEELRQNHPGLSQSITDGNIVDRIS